MYRWRIKRYCGIILTFLENWIGRFLIVFFDFWQIYLKESVLASWCPNTNSYISLSPFNSNLVFMESNWSGCIGIPTRSNTQILRMASRDFILSILVSATTKQWPTRWTWVWFNQSQICDFGGIKSHRATVLETSCLYQTFKNCSFKQSRRGWGKLMEL